MGSLMVDYPDHPDMCPHCGYDLRTSEPIVLGDWKLTPTEIYYQGQAQLLTAQQIEFMYSVAKAYPRTITTEALMNRLGVENPNHIAVVKSKIASWMPNRFPIVNVHRQGYKWLTQPTQPTQPDP